MHVPSPFYDLLLLRCAHRSGASVVHFGDPFREYEAMLLSCGLVDRSDLAKLRISGTDRVEWLQGQVSNDVRTLAESGYLPCLVCSPTGQIVAECVIWDMTDCFLLLAPGIRRVQLIQRLEKMLVTEDVIIEDLTERYALFTLVGPEVSKEWLEDRHTRPTAAVRGTGYDVLVHEDQVEPYLHRLQHSVIPVGGLAYNVRRIEDGIPVSGQEISEATFPQEMGPDFEDTYVSYSKGCYTGQEVIARIRSRGRTHRSLVGIRWDRDVSPGTQVSHEGVAVGTVTSSCRSFALGVPISLAVLRKEAAGPGTLVRAGSATGEVSKLPFVSR